jgi:hypothetical protein
MCKEKWKLDLKKFLKLFLVSVKLHVLLLFFCLSSWHGFGLVPVQADTKWDPYTTNLKIESPRAEVRPHQEFYLRHTQNADSFEKTKSITWSIKNAENTELYRSTKLGKIDDDQRLSLPAEGDYKVFLELLVGEDKVQVTKEIKVFNIKNSSTITNLEANRGLVQVDTETVRTGGEMSNKNLILLPLLLIFSLYILDFILNEKFKNRQSWNPAWSSQIYSLIYGIIFIFRVNFSAQSGDIFYFDPSKC